MISHEVAHQYRLAAPQVVNFESVWMIERGDDSFGGVFNVCPIAFHVSFVEERDGFAVENRLRPFIRSHVGSAARSVDVEESERGDGQTEKDYERRGTLTRRRVWWRDRAREG